MSKLSFEEFKKYAVATRSFILNTVAITIYKEANIYTINDVSYLATEQELTTDSIVRLNETFESMTPGFYLITQVQRIYANNRYYYVVYDSQNHISNGFYLGKNRLDAIENRFSALKADLPNRVSVLENWKNSNFSNGDVTLIVNKATGSDADGIGTYAKPFATISKAVNMIPKNLNGNKVTVSIVDGNYEEVIYLKGFTNGSIEVRRYGSSNLKVNSLCNVWNLKAEFCDSVTVSALNFIDTRITSTYFYRCNYAYVNKCQSISAGPNNTPSYFFDTVPNGVIQGSYSLNHTYCLELYNSCVYSDAWYSGSTGTSYGTYIDLGSTLMKGVSHQQPKGVSSDEFRSSGGSVIVNDYGALIGTLKSTANIYVNATTGNDNNTGTGGTTQFKTISKALSTLPKDLGGFTANIYLSAGTYSEVVNIKGFTNGNLIINSPTPTQISTSTKIQGLYISNCTASVSINGINITNPSNSTTINIEQSKDVLLSCIKHTDLFDTGERGIIVRQTNLARIMSCEISNKQIVLQVESSGCFINNCSGATNDMGIVSSNASTVYISGTIPSSSVPKTQYTGGVFIESSGTQINFITGSLSLTWGTITSGGYARNGNSNGLAMITVQIAINTTTNLTADTQYIINGLPYSISDVSATVSLGSVVRNCYVSSTGQLRFTATQGIASGTTIVFNCTYRTSS